MKFVIFHGAFGSPEGNWFPELKEKLEALNQEVIIPRFPVDNWDEVTKAGPNKENKNQNLDNWLRVFEKEVLPQIKKGDKLCFVGHSIGPVFILHAVEKFSLQLDCAIFIAPFLEKLSRQWQIDLVNKTFYKTDFNYKKLEKLISISYSLYSENDPYVPQNRALGFIKALKSTSILVKGAGHMNEEIHYKPSLIFELCTTRIDLSVYNK